MAVQAKFGQYLQDAKDPMLISQTEKTVEWEQVSSKEQVLPMPDIGPKIFILLKKCDLITKENLRNKFAIDRLPKFFLYFFLKVHLKISLNPKFKNFRVTR